MRRTRSRAMIYSYQEEESVSIPDEIKTNPAVGDVASGADQTIDITREYCPMTFVRTRLALDRLASGQKLLVLLKGDEPRRNVPRTAAEQGHLVLAMTEGADGVTRLLLRRK